MSRRILVAFRGACARAIERAVVKLIFGRDGRIGSGTSC